ncbi:RHS repeat-associated core domain-containing protein [Caballeronia ptereochthonis]|uniref:Rhs family protein n=1 Tax=Caballeronia ptereochthonis TaxID=1777144 RepID=A0A158DP85_9BURK|nr:RHS repeat-associated core domain-containing protein [Caballeronia ptereochthonis]SAK96404.1 Rhs family protein [Caballeronia ptereochthonis]
MSRTKWTPQQVQQWANSNSSSNGSSGGSGNNPGNTIGNPAVGPTINSGPIGTYGLHKGVNLKATDPEWKEHFHEVMDMFGNIPVIGTLFNGINAGVYIAEGNAAGAAEALANTIMDLLPGGGEVASSVKVAEDVGKLAEKSGVKLAEGEAQKVGERVAEKQAEKQAQKQGEKQGEKEAEKQGGQDGGKAVKEPVQACRNSHGVGHPVNPVTGAKFLSAGEDLDFELPARLPLPWQRSYFSDLAIDVGLGQGWTLPFSQSLKRVGDTLTLVDAQGHNIRLPMPGAGDPRFVMGTGYRVCGEANGRYRVTSANSSMHYLFGPVTVSVDDPVGRRACHLPLLGIEDRHGNHVRLLYDDAVLPVSIHDSSGRVLELQYEALPIPDSTAVWRLQCVTLGTKVLVSYEYSREGDLIRVRDSEGRATREYRYINHILTEHSQPGALIARYEYDLHTPQGRVLRIDTNLMQTWQFRYLQGKTEVTDPMGQTSCYLFNDQLAIVGHVDAAGNETKFDVDASGQTVRSVDSCGRMRDATYDRWGNRTSLMDAAGERVEIQHHPLWQRPVAVTDPLGTTTRYEYDASGNLSRATNALGHVTTFGYDSRGALTRITDAQGKRRRLEYDERGQLIAYTDCADQTTRYGWDEYGRLRFVTNAIGETTRHWYDLRGRLLKIQHPDGSSAELTRDAHGRVVSYTDPLGATTRWERSADGRPVVRIDALGHRVHYRYDAARRLTELINENGARYQFAYDAVGRLIEEVGFDGRLVRYRYDPSGYPSEKLDFGARRCSSIGHCDGDAEIRTRYERDRAGRIVATVRTRARDERVERTTWRYDAAGRLIEACNDCSRLERIFDAVGQLVTETVHVLGRSLKLDYHHDELGNHIATTLPDGRQIQYLHYGPGHVHRISIDHEVISEIERDALHREVSRTQGGLISRYRYDCRARLLDQQTFAGSASGHEATLLVSRAYRYDRAGNLCEMTDLQSGVHRYAYDLLGRLIQSDRQCFHFDPAHNLLGARAASPVIDNRVTESGRNRYVHDTYGNVIEKICGAHAHIHFDHSLNHQIERARIHRSNGEKEIVEYGYDALGRRLFKRDAAAITFFVWESNRLLSEIREDQTYVYLHAPNSFAPLAQVRTCDRADVGEARRTSVLYYHTDQAGMPLEMTDIDGRVQWRARSMAWGNIAETEGTEDACAFRPPDARAAHMHQPLRFQGQYFDAETGLHYNQYRYYDPDAGRFVTPDPIGLLGGMNLYAYPPNPGRWIDPMGLQGVNLNLAGPLVAGWSSLINHGTNIFSVLSHGNPMGVTGETIGDYISASEMAHMIRNSPGFRADQTIWLIACYAGAERDLANPHDTSYGQELANETGQTVIAPTGPAIPRQLGNTAYLELPPGVQWLTFHPHTYTLTVL